MGHSLFFIHQLYHVKCWLIRPQNIVNEILKHNMYVNNIELLSH